MPTKIKVWEIEQGKLVPVKDAALADYRREAELEDWLVQSPDILGEDLLVISKQLEIAGVGRLDLLCMDVSGRLVIVELKRDLSPREAVAQALDYASWLDNTTEEEVRAHAHAYLGRELDEAFEEHFRAEVPDWVCQNHRILLVAAGLDASAERIINYLADRHNVQINAVFFAYARLRDGKEILLRSVLVPEDVTRAAGARRKPTEGALMAMAAERRTVPLVEVCRELKTIWGEEKQNTGGGSFRYWSVTPDGRPKMVYGINVSGGLAQPAPAELDVWIRTESLAEVTGTPAATIRERFSRFSPFVAGAMDFMVRVRSTREAEELVSALKHLVSEATTTGKPR